jgi:hypothetical protein
MTTKSAAVLVGVTAVALATVAWSAAPNVPASAAPGDSTLSFDVEFSPFFYLDFGPTGVREVTDVQAVSPSKGDQTSFGDRLLRRGQVVGYQGGVCTITRFDPAVAEPPRLTCHVGYELPGGQVTAQGTTTPDPVKRLAVTGGTGRYSGVGGEVTITEFGDGTGRVEFRFTRRTG